MLEEGTQRVLGASDGVTPGRSGEISAPLFRFHDRRPVVDAWTVLPDGALAVWPPGAYAVYDGSSRSAVLVACVMEAHVRGPMLWAPVSYDGPHWEQEGQAAMRAHHIYQRRARRWARWSLPIGALVMIELTFQAHLFGEMLPWWASALVALVGTLAIVIMVRGGLAVPRLVDYDNHLVVRAPLRDDEVLGRGMDDAKN